MTPRVLVLVISLLGITVGVTSGHYLAAFIFAVTELVVLWGDRPQRPARNERMVPWR